MNLKDRIAAAQTTETGKAQRGRQVSLRIPKREYGRIEHELWFVGQPHLDPTFGILRRPEDLATLINLCEKDGLSTESRQKIDEFLKDRASQAVTDLKKWLGVRRGRRPNLAKQKIWAAGSALRRKGWSWAKITLELDPQGYAENAQRATDRMRQGIQWVEGQARKRQVTTLR